MTDRHLQVVKSEARPPAEIAAERLQALVEFVELHGLDYWDHHEPEQPDLESEAA